MTTAIRIAKNSSFIFLGDITSTVLQLILSIYLVRYLGDVSYGIYSFALSFTTFFTITADLGLNVVIIREIARDLEKTSEYLTNIFIIKILLTIFTAILIFIITNLMPFPQETRIIIYLLSALMLLNTFILFFRSVFRSFERMQYETISKIAERAITFGLVIIIIFLGLGLIQIAIAMLVAEIITFIITFTYMSIKFAKPNLIYNKRMCINLIKESIPFGLAGLFSISYLQPDILILYMLKGDAVVGWYSAAYRLAMATLIIPNALIGALYPVLSKYFTSSKDSLVFVNERALKYIIIIAFFIGFFTILLSDKIILLLYGNEFYNSIVALQILIIAAMILFPMQVLGVTLASINKQWINTGIESISMLVFIMLDFILIPSYSYIGAGIALVISQLIVLCYEFYYLQKINYNMHLKPTIFKLVIAVLIMGIAIYGIKLITQNLIILVPSMVIIFLICLFLLKVLDEKDFKILKSILKINF